MQRRSFLASMVTLPAAAELLLPQQAPATPQAAAPGQPTFTSGVNEVIVPVTVTDEKGRFVSDLDRKDFKIFDEGVEQQIGFFTRERGQPVVVGFLLDLSNNMKTNWKTYAEAIQEMVLGMMPAEDKRFSGYLISYSDTPELQVNTTSDSALLTEKIRKLKPGGGAAMYDAIWMACTTRALVKGEPYEPRRVIVVIGDGHDNASQHTLDQIVEIAQRNLVTVYALNTVGFGFTAEGEGPLKRLTEETGGRVEYPLQNVYKDVDGFLSKPSDYGNYALKVGTGQYANQVAQGLYRAIEKVVGEVTTQYIIRYTPANITKTDRTFRNVRVEVVGYPTAKVRTRKGYYPNNT